MLGRVVDVVSESGRRVAAAHSFSVTDKGSRENIVTSADIENERFLRSRLTSLVPGSAFVGEEGDESPILDDGYTWIVDPIDGTMNFSRGIPEVGISVALFKDGEPYIGVVHNPFTGRMYSAEVGRAEGTVLILMTGAPYEDDEIFIAVTETIGPDLFVTSAEIGSFGEPEFVDGDVPQPPEHPLGGGIDLDFLERMLAYVQSHREWISLAQDLASEIRTQEEFSSRMVADCLYRDSRSCEVPSDRRDDDCDDSDHVEPIIIEDSSDEQPEAIIREIRSKFLAIPYLVILFTRQSINRVKVGSIFCRHIAEYNADSR